MGEKSYVSLAQKVCPVCGTTHDVGVLLDKRLRNSMERSTITGYELCPEHKKMSEDGYMLLVEVDESQSSFEADGNLKPEGAYRTGTLIGIKRDEAERLFNVSMKGFSFVYIDPKAVERIKAALPESEQEGS